MVKFKELFDYDLPDTTTGEEWDSTKEVLKDSLDLTISRGIVDKETLQIMKELLDIYKPVTMEDYLEDEDCGN